MKFLKTTSLLMLAAAAVSAAQAGLVPSNLSWINRGPVEHFVVGGIHSGPAVRGVVHVPTAVATPVPMTTQMVVVNLTPVQVKNVVNPSAMVLGPVEGPSLTTGVAPGEVTRPQSTIAEVTRKLKEVIELANGSEMPVVELTLATEVSRAAARAEADKLAARIELATNIEPVIVPSTRAEDLVVFNDVGRRITPALLEEITEQLRSEVLIGNASPTTLADLFASTEAIVESLRLLALRDVSKQGPDAGLSANQITAMLAALSAAVIVGNDSNKTVAASEEDGGDEATPSTTTGTTTTTTTTTATSTTTATATATSTTTGT
jgi:hypothetical protein